MLEVKAGRKVYQIDALDMVNGVYPHAIITIRDSGGDHPQFSKKVFSELVKYSVLIPHETFENTYVFNVPLMEKMRVYNKYE